MENNNSEKEIDKRKEIIKDLLIVAGVIIGAVILVYICEIGLLISDEKYHHFGPKRVSEMEACFNITVTDDIKLKKYVDSSFLVGIEKNLYLEVEDYEKFLEENVNYEIEQVERVDMAESSDNGYISFHGKDNPQYEIYVTIPEDNGKYSIRLHYFD